ncbi:DNA repair exonuclease [Metabacillus fastidiosus]|uniref:metallophosphoesterase family protein n=1 Tax=Metabacillus fastidiosus TaxID=1458 RepID=UPI002E232497|nr:DNA repair exonuclease [Metabacillus fastidiosus]
MKKIRFIHAADLHLDSPFTGLKSLPSSIFERLKESTFTAFSRLISISLKEKVDFILISGDLYDGEERSLKAQLRLKKGFEKLKEAGIEVFIIHGNHDHMGGKWIELEWPENVHVFSSGNVELKTAVKNDRVIANIYGYSYPSRAVMQNITGEFKKVFQPDDIFHIGMLHGTIEGNEEHDRYCPFRLSELVEKNFDYWALGHIHKRQVIKEQAPAVIYPGNIQGRNRKEAGDKGFYLIELDENSTESTFIAVSDVIWEDIEISIESLTNISQFMKRCKQLVETIRREQKGIFLHIYVTGTGQIADVFQNEKNIEELSDSLNELEEGKENFVWIISIINESYMEYELRGKELHFFSDLEKTVHSYNNFDEALAGLTDHPLFRKSEIVFTEEEKQQLLKAAEFYLYKELFHYKGERE